MEDNGDPWLGMEASNPLQRIQKAAYVVDSIDLKQIWRPNLTWKHGCDGNAHCRGLTKQVSVDAIKFTFPYYNAWVL